MEIDLAEAYEFMLYPKRIKSPFGGRGSAKTEEIAEILVWNAHDNGKRVLCGREFQNSINDSVYNVIVAKIDKYGLNGNFFDVQANGIYGRNGSCFEFTGLARNIESLKSKFGYDILWIEEAETMSQRSIDVIIPTIRSAGSEIWFTWNPNESIAPIYQFLVAPHINEINKNGFYEDEYMYVKKVSFRDNPWFPDVLRVEMEKLKTTNYKKFLHVWEGECNADYEDSIIEPEWVDAAIDAHIKLKYTTRGERVLSFDPADSGQDSKAIAKRYGMLVEDIKQWKTGDIDDAIAIAFDEAFDYRAEILTYDSVGVGAGVKVGLKDRIGTRKIEVLGFSGGESPTPGLYKEDRQNKDVFLNKRAQYWWLLRDRFERTYQAVKKGEYHDPATLISLSSDIKDLDALKAELVRQQRKRTSGSRLIQLVSKDEMRKDNIPSPNMADALMQSFAVDAMPKKVQPIVPLPTRTSYSSPARR